MADDFVVASEKYGSGSLERKYRFSAENGKVERIGRRGGTITSSLKQFFKVITWFEFSQSCNTNGVKCRNGSGHLEFFY